MSQLRETGLSVLNVESTPEVFIVTPFTQTPFDVLEAVANLGLGRYEQVVLLEIQKQIYGPSKASVANISQADISRFYGAKRQNISRGLQSLLKLRIIVQQSGGYRFNTVASEWTVNGQTIPSFASQVTTTADHPCVDVIKSDYKPVIKSDDKSTHPESACNQIRLQMSSNSMTNVIENDDTSSIEKNLERTRTEGVVEESGSDQKQEYIHPQGKSVLTSQESSPPAPPLPDAPPRDWAKEIYDWVGEHGCDPDVFYAKLSAWVKVYGGEWTFEAIKTTVLGPKRSSPVSYALGILDNYKACGGIEQAKAKHEAAKQEAKKPAPEPVDMTNPKNWTPEYREQRRKWMEELKALEDAERPQRLERARREKEEREKKWGLVG